MKTRNVAISEDAWLRVVTWAATATMSAGRRVTIRKVVEDAVARHVPADQKVAESAARSAQAAPGQREFDFCERGRVDATATTDPSEGRPGVSALSP